VGAVVQHQLFKRKELHLAAMIAAPQFGKLLTLPRCICMPPSGTMATQLPLHIHYAEWGRLTIAVTTHLLEAEVA
jgi:hypothetical protein